MAEGGDFVCNVICGKQHSRLTPKRGGIVELDLNAFNLFGKVFPADWILGWYAGKSWLAVL